MLEKIKYVNNRGETLVFGEHGLYVNENDLRDWEWSFSTDYGKIRNFRRSSITRTLPVRIWAETEAKGMAIKNKLHDVTEIDVIAGTPGRLYVGDCYMLCYITASKKSNYLMSKNIMSVSLTVAASEGVWYHETSAWFGERPDLTLANVDSALVGFAKVAEEASEGEGTESTEDAYTYGYPRGYEATVESRENYLVNEFLTPCAFRIEIEGRASNPEIVIGGNSHKLKFAIEAGQSAVIDSRERTITLITSNGQEANLFRHRDKESDIFAAITPGKHLVEWNGDFIFNITLYKERSEPLWT